VHIEIIISKYLTAKMQYYLDREFIHWSQKKRRAGVSEFFKFMEIATTRDKTTFIPLTKDGDDIWHLFILQTREYKTLCDKIMPNSFLDHESESYDSYSFEMTNDEANREDLFWLGKYYMKFSPFNEDTLPF
jgi:hypothetical protein